MVGRRVWLRVPLDKSEGVVKTHFSAAMLSSTTWISEWWRTEALILDSLGMKLHKGGEGFPNKAWKP